MNVLSNSFCIKECLCTVWNVQILSFIRYELLSFEHGNPILHKMYNIILLLFVRIQSSFFQPEVLHFLPIYFPHIVSISGKHYLFSWERLDSKKFNLCMTTS